MKINIIQCKIAHDLFILFISNIFKFNFSFLLELLFHVFYGV